MHNQASSKVKFEIIHKAIKTDGNLLCVSEMCRLAGVSRSGFYNWKNGFNRRNEAEIQDKKDFEVILKAYNFRGYAKGARSIYMRLLHKDIRMNIKKIRRLMKKYQLYCPIRRINPYKKMARAMQTSHVSSNVVDRNFLSRGARKVLLTDITYIFFRTGKCYLSTILDAYTREILAYKLSESLKVDFVINTVEDLIERHDATLDNETIIHSDQGCHYTSNAFIDKLKDENFIQSMSRKGNCWDNAPQESFFGHMKDEISSKTSQKQCFEDVSRVIDDWIDYYNRDRYQWDLLKLSPNEFYRYAITGVYPLKPYGSADVKS